MSSGDSFPEAVEPKEVAKDHDVERESAAVGGATTLKRNLHNRHMQMIAIGMLPFVNLVVMKWAA
jgi:amino acid permease